MDMAQPPDIIASGPPGVPPPPPPPPSGRPRDEDRLTRKPLSIWDRIKFLLLLVLVWFLLVWSAMANNPLIGFSDAMRIEVRTGWWVFVLHRPGAAPADSLPHQRALGGLPPVLDRDRSSAASSGPPTGGSPTGPGSASGGC